MNVLRIWASVGRNGVNRRTDVLMVQQLINNHLPPQVRLLRIDGLCGPLTIAAIEEIQRCYLYMSLPDGRMDPNGRTLRALNEAKTAPKVRTPLIGAFPLDVIQAAEASQSTWDIPAAVTLAQWALESDFGRSTPPGSNNPFGIKALPGEPFVMAPTHEIINGHDVVVLQPFRKFASINQAFDEHARLLATAPQYAPARKLADDPDAFADALTGVYATDPNYGSALKRRMKDHDLYQFDVSLIIPGTWTVKIGVWTWIYTFDGNHSADFGVARRSNLGRTESGRGRWTLKNPNPESFLEINWDPNKYSPIGSRELWNPPIKDQQQVSTQGTLVDGSENQY